MNIQVGKSYKDNNGNVWECVMTTNSQEIGDKCLTVHFSEYIKPPSSRYAISFDHKWCHVIVDRKRKYFESCENDGQIWKELHLVEEIVPAEKVVKKFFIIHKKTKHFHCVDENNNVCLFDDEKETRHNIEIAWKMDPLDFIKVNITFDEYLELTGLKRKDSLADCKLKLLNSFGCQTSLLAPILKKVEELLAEISNAKANKLALKNLEKLAVKSVMELFSEKMRKLGGAFVMEEDEIRTTKMFLEYIELFEKQLTKTAN